MITESSIDSSFYTITRYTAHDRGWYQEDLLDPLTGEYKPSEFSSYEAAAECLNSLLDDPKLFNEKDGLGDEVIMSIFLVIKKITMSPNGPWTMDETWTQMACSSRKLNMSYGL